MRVRTVGYFFGQAGKSMRRNGWMTVTTLATVAVSLFISGAFIFLILNVNGIVAALESDVEIAAFLKVDADPAEVRSMEDSLSLLSGVEKVTLVPKEQGLRDLSRQFGRDSALLDALGGVNPLPDYYLIKVTDPQQVAQVAGKIRGIPLVEEVNYGEGYVERLFAILNWLRFGGMVALVTLLAAAVFLVSMTVRLTVFARRKEIGILKYVGATDWFIRWPFLLEGVILGGLGSVVATAALYFLYNILADRLAVTLAFLPLVRDQELIIQVLLWLVFTGGLVGALGSVLSMRRFLRV